MSKHKVGDKFIIEIEEIYNGDLTKHEEHLHLHRIKGFNSLVLDEYGLDKLQKIKPELKIEDIDDMISEHDLRKTSYNQGMTDAWELAKKIADITLTSERAKIFGYVVDGIIVTDILRDFTPQEALAKLKAYEERIEVGDVITYSGEKGLVLDIKGSKVVVLTDDGCVQEWYECDVEKTGKHIDITSILEQIGD